MPSPSNIPQSRAATALLPVATGITLVTIIGFFYISYTKELASLPMNEIGDAVSGFSSFLAFLWLIVTVVLQYKELQLQRQEIADLRAASEDQAKTLRMTNRVHTLTLIRSRQEDVYPYLSEGVKTNAHIVVNFLKEHLGFQYHDEFLTRPDAGIPYILGYFLLEDHIDDQASIQQALSEGILRRDFEYESFVKLDSILLNMEGMWNVLKPIWLLAKQSEAEAEYIAWETSIGIAWYRRYYQIVKSLVHGLRTIIVAGEVGDKLQQLIAKGELKYEAENDSTSNTGAFTYTARGEPSEYL